MNSPVFIGGCDRSGTTLLGAMLGSTENAIATPESQFKIDMIHGGFEDSPHKWRLRVWKLEDKSIAPIIKSSWSAQEKIAGLVNLYADKEGRSDVDKWIDHTPDNIRNVSTLIDAFPDAKFVHIIRDGRAICASVLKLSWGPFNVYDAANWWMAKVGLGLAAAQAHPHHVITVRYEDLLTDTEHQLRRLCDFCDLTFHPSMMSGSAFNVPKYTAAQHALVGQPPHVSRMNAWEEVLTNRQIEVFESRVGDMLSYLGYEQRFRAARPPSMAEMIGYKFSILPMALGRLRWEWRRRVRASA